MLFGGLWVISVRFGCYIWCFILFDWLKPLAYSVVCWVCCSVMRWVVGCSVGCACCLVSGCCFRLCMFGGCLLVSG